MQSFHIERKIYYHHTDAEGVVYYANYLQFLEEGRSQFLLHGGINTSNYLKQGIIFPVVHIEIEFKSPARYGETVKIQTRIDHIGNSSIHFIQEIMKGDTILVKAKTVWACVGNDFKSILVPDDFKKTLGDS